MIIQLQFSEIMMKIKIKKNTERIKNIIECNIELEIRFKT
jgi:hypothetical protein